MSEFTYTAWFRDTSLQPKDEDYEWPACITIQAVNADDAKKWGDHLSARYSKTHPHELLFQSAVEPMENLSGNNQGTLKISYGHEATDAEIGW